MGSGPSIEKTLQSMKAELVHEDYDETNITDACNVLFLNYDHDRNGLIQREEMQHFAKDLTLHMRAHFKNEHDRQIACDQLIESWDQDGTEGLSRKEFQVGMLKFFTYSLQKRRSF